MLVIKKLSENHVYTISFFIIGMFFNVMVYLFMKVIPFVDFTQFLDLSTFSSYIAGSIYFTFIGGIVGLLSTEIAEEYDKNKRKIQVK